MKWVFDAYAENEPKNTQINNIWVNVRKILEFSVQICQLALSEILDLDVIIFESERIYGDEFKWEFVYFVNYCGTYLSSWLHINDKFLYEELFLECEM